MEFVTRLALRNLTTRAGAAACSALLVPGSEGRRRAVLDEGCPMRVPSSIGAQGPTAPSSNHKSWRKNKFPLNLLEEKFRPVNLGWRKENFVHRLIRLPGKTMELKQNTVL